MESRLLQSQNTDVPRETKPLGMLTKDKLLHPLNALFRI